MSFTAVTWAFEQTVDKASAKFVLVAMAQCVNAKSDDMVSWASARRLATMTGQDIKTVESALKRLRESGHIVDTGARVGSTGQVIVYRLNTPENGGVTDSGNTPKFPTKTSEFGGVEDDSNTPVFPVKHPRFSLKDPRFSRQTPPKTGDGIGKGIGKNRERNREERACTPATPDVPDSLMADYLKVRAAKKAGPLTETALAGLRREAAKAGITLAAAITVCCERGWQGFKADWIANTAHGAARPPPPTAAEARRQRNADVVAELTGRRPPPPPNPERTSHAAPQDPPIDVESRIL